MRNDQILSDSNEISESTSRTPVYSMSDPLFWQKPALSVWKDLVWIGFRD